MKSAITAMRRYGRHWLVVLACGHQFTVTAAEVKAEQLYIGKRIVCEVCREKPSQSDPA